MKRRILTCLIIILGSTSLATGVFAQTSRIRILDESTSEPVPLVSVVLYDLNGNYIKGAISDHHGMVTFEIKEKSKLEISCVGFEKCSSLISPGEGKDILVKKDFLELEPVVVTGQYNPKPVDKSIYKIDLISSRQLEERGVNNLAEALANETNIRLSVDPALGTSLKLQGMGGENVKFLIDGVPVVGRLDGNVDLTQINMDNVDHIEIVKGPMSVVYGTNALAGVVNIIMKENTKFDNSLKLSSYTGTEGAYNFSGSGSFIRKNNTFSLQGARNMFQGMDLSEDTRYMEFKPKLQYNAGLDYAYRKNDFKLRLSSKYFDEEIRHYGNPQGISVTDQYFYTKRFVGSIQVNEKFRDNLFFEALGAYSPYERKTQNYRKDLTNFEQIEVGEATITNFSNIMFRTSMSYENPGSKLSAQFGLDMNRDDASGDKISSDDPTMGDYAAFLSARYQFLPSATIQPGLRFIYNTKYPAPVSPSINLMWGLFRNFDLRVSYARGFRAPSIKELYLDFVDSNHDLHGNEDLEAETNNSFNTSILYRIEGSNFLIKLEPDFFFNYGKNVIQIAEIDPGSNVYQNTNIGKRKTLGGEFNASFLVFPNLTLNAGYGLTGESNLMDPETDEFPDYNFYSNIILNSKYKFRKQKLIFAAYFKYYGATPVLTSLETGEFGYINKDPYGDLEVTATKQLWKNRISLILGGKNLLNVKYVGYEDDREASPAAFGRYYFLKLNLSLNK